MHERTQYTPLTYEEQRFAEKNHWLVLDYLRRRNLDPNDWYDVVIFSYLLAVKKWFQRSDLHQWTFRTIASQGMRSAIGNEYRKRERRIQTVSLDGVVPGTEDLRLIDTVTNENLNFVIYVEGEDMNISYDVMVPERIRKGVGVKSDEIIALESFLKQKKTENMRMEYGTPEEAKKKIPTLQSYRRTNNLKEVFDVFRVESNIYVVRIKKGEKTSGK